MKKFGSEKEEILKKIHRSILSVALCASLLGASTACAAPVDDRGLTPQEYSVRNLAATDALGRSFDIAGAKREGKTVGLFYSLWLGQHSSTGIFDIQYMLENDPETLNDPTVNLGQFHFWGKPLYGYYSMSDPFVITRHVELLTMAGVDYLCIDATNKHIYETPGKLLLRTLQKFAAQGFEVPKVCFYTNTGSGETVEQLYETYYKSGEFEDMWYAPNGRPVVVGITENNQFASDQFLGGNVVSYVSERMQEYFDVWESQWPTGEYNADAYSWMTWKLDRLVHNGHAAVPVAQHSHTSIDASSEDPECSRAYNNFTQKKEGDWKEGKSFETMWEAVFEQGNKVNDVLCTSFNEWQAQKYARGSGVGFVDVYNWEYSRDIEMMEGGYGDNFYLQLVRNLRKFKYEKGKSYAMPSVTIDISMDDPKWENVTARYADFEGDAIARNYLDAAGQTRYIDVSARNDITDIRVLHDADFLYFRIQTAEEITSPEAEDLGWMNLLIGTGEGSSFEGYQYVVNRYPENGSTSVERSKGGYHWERVGNAELRYEENILFFKIPRAALDLGKGTPNITFKVCDNVINPENIMDYYITGDCAPIGRLSYRYGG